MAKSTKDSKFWISQSDWNTVIAYAESAYSQMKSEIGGQMVVVEDKDGDFILKDPVILKQEVSASNCEMEAEALAVHYSKMATKHGDNVRHCWWHSHHTMGAFWSGTDNNTIMQNNGRDFTVSLVVNLKEECKLRIQFFYPFEHEENVTLNIIKASTTRDDKLDKEVENLCTKETVYAMPRAKTSNNQLTLSHSRGIEEYNRSFGYGGYSPYDKIYHTVDMSKVPKNKVGEVNDLVETLQDAIIDSSSFTYSEYLNMRNDINNKIRKYNLKVTMMDKENLETLAYHYWPEDFLENILSKKEEINVYQ